MAQEKKPVNFSYFKFPGGMFRTRLPPVFYFTTVNFTAMSYFILMGRRIPKQTVTGFKFQNETSNIIPFLSIRIRGKEEIIPFKEKKEMLPVKVHLCSVFSGFVKIGDWYLKMSEIKEYKPVTAEDMNPYILFKTSKFGNIKVRFSKDEDMNAELLVLDQLFDVE